jgi:hypothetical protein
LRPRIAVGRGIAMAARIASAEVAAMAQR